MCLNRELKQPEVRSFSFFKRKGTELFRRFAILVIMGKKSAQVQSTPQLWRLWWRTSHAWVLKLYKYIGHQMHVFHFFEIVQKICLSPLMARMYTSRTCLFTSRGYSWEFLVGVCRLVLQILTRFQTKKCNFPYPFSDQTSKIHTRFQTWPLGRNYVIIT